MLEPSIAKTNSHLFKDIPPPPPLPKYDPTEEAPMWTMKKTKWLVPIDKPKPWTGIGTRPESDDDPDWRGVIRSKVIEYPMPEPYNLADFKDKPAYYFFDTPDYADPFKKLFWSSKYFLKTGILMAAFVDLIEKTKGTPLSRYMRLTSTIILPWWAAGMAASATVVTVANLRNKKDDKWNYAAAGAVAAMVLGRNSCLRLIQNTVLCIPAALCVKHAAEENLSLWPMYNYRGKNLGLHGQSAEQGIASGDFRLGIRGRNYGDPGRDVRKTW